MYGRTSSSASSATSSSSRGVTPYASNSHATDGCTVSSRAIVSSSNSSASRRMAMRWIASTPSSSSSNSDRSGSSSASMRTSNSSSLTTSSSNAATRQNVRLGSAGLKRILVACVGNPLRADDGFGYAVAQGVAPLPHGAELVETGIGGVALLQELMSGFDGLIIVDALDRNEAPGTV